MEPSDRRTLASQEDHDDGSEGGISRPIIAFIVATVVLYLGKDLLLPLAMAAILAVAFSPLASRLEPLVGRFLSAALLVIVAISALGATGYFLTVGLTSVAAEIGDYSNNIASKIVRLQGTTPAWLQHFEHGVNKIQHQVERKSPRLAAATPKVIQVQPQPVLKDVFVSAWPILAGVGEGLLIIVLLFFLLYGRHDLRNRFARLAARARVPVASQAIEAAGSAVGRYLILLALINLGFGIAVGLIVAVIGLPNPAFWGGLAFLLRFIPYVGALSAALLPTLVAFAVFPGWTKSFELFGAFVVFDQLAAQLVEPVLIGRGIGVSPIALLVSAMYWAWLWGLPGLLLSTPLTACLKVAGDYIPELGFFSILLGADTTLEDYNDYYRMLLELDQPGARALALKYCGTYGLEAAFDDVLIPALTLAGTQCSEGHIGQDTHQFVIQTTRNLVTEMGDRFVKPRGTPKLRILGFCAPGEVHDLGLMMLLELMRHAGAAANLIDGKSPAQLRDFVNRYAPDMVSLSCTDTQFLPAAADLLRDLKLDSPDLMILGGGAAALAQPAVLLNAGCSFVCASRGDVRRLMRRFAIWRAKSRTVSDSPAFVTAVAAPPVPAAEPPPTAKGQP